jgi:class 3 adenylate cyclase/tetratricopeptide (TPR) repeat protein
MSDQLLTTLNSYVPTFITRRLALDPASLNAPTYDTITTAVLFADISGFTALTEKLAERGPSGAEELTLQLNNYFGQLIDLITAHGGDIAKFAGDSLIALWYDPEEAKDDLAVKDQLQNNILLAAQCALMAQTKLANFPLIEGQRLFLKIAIGAGEIVIPYLGGVFNRWEYLITGQPLAELNAADYDLKPGHVIVTPHAWTFIAMMAEGNKLPSSNVLLKNVKAGMPTAVIPIPPLSTEAIPRLNSYIPHAITHRLNAGQAGWLAEMRRVTVIFVNLPDLSHNTPLTESQAIMKALQTTLYRYEGSLNKISVDDKGAMLVAALGLPPLAHSDDAARGVLAAQAMLTAVRKYGKRCAIGITTGRAFCGSVGNEKRREYTMIGMIVNMAARLMQASLLYGEAIPILCDQTTYEDAHERINFGPLPPIMVKGKADPIKIYRPQEEKQKALQTIVGARSGMVGRFKERLVIAQHLEKTKVGANSTLVIEGEAGIGKSQLVAELLEQAQAAGLAAFVGMGDSVERTTSYFAWRPIFQRLFNLNETTELAGSRLETMEQLAGNPELLQRMPLLNVVLPLNLPDNELTAQMSGDIRANNTRDLLTNLILQANQKEPLLIIMDDAHWLDSPSWALLARLRREADNLLLVIVTRPFVEGNNGASPNRAMPDEFKRLLAEEETEQLILTALTASETAHLVAQRLGVQQIAPAVATLIFAQAEGHPFFSEQIAYALRDAGHLQINHDRCSLATDLDELKRLRFPDTIQGVITSRLDRLPAEQQFILKIASVIGRSFPYQTLRAIHPVSSDRMHLRDYLANLDHGGLIDVETPEPELTYTFRHIITQEVAYQMLPLAQRQQLHRALAQWLEEAYATDLPPYFTLLAYHWSKVIEDQKIKSVYVGKAVNYLEKSGEQSLRDGAYREAVEYLLKAIKTAQILGGEDKIAFLNPQRRANWHILLGIAYTSMGQPASGRLHFHNALSILERPIPTSQTMLMQSLATHFSRHIMQLILPARWREPSARAREAILAAASAFSHLAQMHYTNSETILAAYTTIRGLNMVEQAGISPEMARLHIQVAVLYRVFRMSRLAGRYEQSGRETAERLNDLPSMTLVLLANAVSQMGIAPWSELQATLDRAIAIAKQIGDQRSWGSGLGMLGYTYLYQGQFKKGAAVCQELLKQGRESDNLEHQAWGLYGHAHHLMLLGHTQQAAQLVEEALVIARILTESRTVEIASRGILAGIRLRQGDRRSARHIADATVSQLTDPLPLNFGLFAAYAGVTEVYLSLWEQQGKTANLQKTAKAACKALRRYALLNPAAQPRAWLHQGQYEWLMGRKFLAKRAWQKALTKAEKLKMAYDVGLAHLEMGRHLSGNAEKRQAFLSQAIGIFTHLQADYDLQRTKAEL